MRSYQLTEFGAPLSVAELPMPKLSGTEVLLRVRAAGVCHTDVHISEGSYDLGGGRRLSLGDRGVRLPLTMGHETAGEVVAHGPEARGVRLGDVRLVYPWLGCAKCALCLDDQEHMCAQPRALGVHRNGGYSDHVVVPHPRYLLELRGLDPVIAAPYACSGLTTYSALRKVGVLLASHATLIIGAGGLGLMALSLLRAMDAVGAIVVDIDESKRSAALSAGAMAAIDGAAPDAAKQIVDAAGGPIRAAIDLVGSPQTAALAFDCIVKGGKIILVGLVGGAAPWALPLVALKAVTIQGSYVGSLSELKELLELVHQGLIPPIPVVRRPLDQANNALDDLRRGAVLGRTVLAP